MTETAARNRRPALLGAAQRIAPRHLAKSVADPALRATLTPGYVMGCKRILPSNDFWPGSTLRFRRATRRIDLTGYTVIPAGAPS